MQGGPEPNTEPADSGSLLRLHHDFNKERPLRALAGCAPAAQAQGSPPPAADGSGSHSLAQLPGSARWRCSTGTGPEARDLERCLSRGSCLFTLWQDAISCFKGEKRLQQACKKLLSAWTSNGQAAS